MITNKHGIIRGLINLGDKNGSAGLGCYYLESWGGGPSYLEIMLSRIRQMTTLDHTVALVHMDIDIRVLELLGKYEIQVLEIESLEDFFMYPNYQKKINSSRKWSYGSWSGSSNGMTIFDEIAPMGMVRFFCAISNPKTLVYFSPEAPFFDPTLADEMVRNSGATIQGAQLDLLCRPVPQGLSPLILSEKLTSNVSNDPFWMPSFFLNTGKYSYKLKIEATFKIPAVENDDRNFLLRSPRDLERLNKWDGKFDKVLPEFSLPKELQIELTSEPQRKEHFLPSPSTEVEMPLGLFGELLLQIEKVEDALLTIGDLGNLWSYSDEQGLLGLFSKHKIYGVHVILDAIDIFADLERFERWVKCDFDIITVRLSSLGSSKDNLLMYEDKVKEINAMVSSVNLKTTINYELQKVADNWRLIEVLQEWNAKYQIAFNWVGFNDYAGQNAKDAQLPVYYPRVEHPCKKLLYQMHILADGSVTSCRQDYKGTCVVGDTNVHKIKEIWNSEPCVTLRQETGVCRDSVTELCQKCKQSHFV
jgi:hypothetical protein